jgi:hypothetical protein
MHVHYNPNPNPSRIARGKNGSNEVQQSIRQLFAEQYQASPSRLWPLSAISGEFGTVVVVTLGPKWLNHRNVLLHNKFLIFGEPCMPKFIFVGRQEKLTSE